ncbi:serine protease SP24D-like [Stomoxys calcitrans]|uniref:serine protease SP24D-like n=1 Tax=Stomoxys calcitrans TaxID=35570 RepID=UPI0027E37339|nr:serine protease SP24D-like [Stomoxys calcitrans]
MSFWENFKPEFLLCFLLAALVNPHSAEGLKHPKRPLQGRIVGGGFATEGQFPYQVSILRRGNHSCGGSIISPHYVVTAAHCIVYGKPSMRVPVDVLNVRAGSISTTSGGQLVNVTEVKPHPSFWQFTNDIALVKLAQPLKFNDNVAAIPLASQNPPSGAEVSTSGWGRISTSGPLSPLLKYNTLVALNTTECRSRLDYLPRGAICFVGATANGICKGDSGGPAVYNNQLVGVVNFFEDACGIKPDGFASVALHAKWLRDNSKE